ncbi:MAG: hypothetical protein E7559_00935 [Ruminococcaceae bacterium]|nr:hypothetical protein [Oscillospiraceae bacterium]
MLAIQLVKIEWLKDSRTPDGARQRALCLQPEQIASDVSLVCPAASEEAVFLQRLSKHLGAEKTSVYYSIAPFLGVMFGWLFLHGRTGAQFYVGLVIMIAATILLIKDTINLQHTHEHVHVHTHEVLEGHEHSHAG